MTEVKREFKVFKAFYICDSCKKGKMKFLYPLEGEGMYYHQRSYCKVCKALFKKYSCIEHERRR